MPGWEAAGVEEVLEAPYPTQSSDLRLEGYTGWTDTEKNKRGRHIIRDAACDICGMEEESEFHGTVSCQHARSLRSAMREHWLLPEEKYLVHTGPEMAATHCEPLGTRLSCATHPHHVACLVCPR